MNSRRSHTPGESYKHLFDKAAEAMFIIDRKDRILEANAMASTLTGYSRRKCAALLFGDIFPNVHSPADPIHRSVSIRDPVTHTERHLKKKDGNTVTVEITGRLLPGGILHAIVREIGQPKDLEMQVRLARMCMDRAEVGIMIVEANGRISMANKQACEWLDGPSRDFVGRIIFDVDKTLTRDRWLAFSEHLRAHGSAMVQMNDLRLGGGKLSVIVRATHLRTGDHEFFLLIARDAAEQKRAEEALYESEQALRTFHQNTLMGLYRSTPEGKILMVNPALLQMLGYGSHEELLTRDLAKEGYVPSYDRGEFLRVMERDGQVIGHEAQWQRRDKTTIWVREGARAVRDKDGKIAYFDGTVEDITERKLAELRLRASLEEKETLLKEVHHRVKNNLQIISSLLNLQASEIADETLFEMFKESQNRIRSLALVHEKLYQGQNLAHVDFLDYLQSVTIRLARVYEREGLAWHVGGDEVYLGIDQAIPCGLIVNELISNAMKHAFVGREQGTLWIELKKLPDARVELRIQDDGVGFPAGKDFREAASMGMVLIMSLVEQIDATISLDRTGGTTFTVQFQPHS